MDPNAVVLDISSDEEVGWGETAAVGGGDDFDWISELLDEVDRETDDSDDVVVVGELVLNQKQRLKSKSSVKDVDDDDCVVLDGDPDKPVAIENDTVGESDDLLVVSEKGQVACRDYPHARHLCAKFPFTSTPHERHCGQCHCYVCDSLAPCVHWGSGISSIDHCHATDKKEFWRCQRKCLKKSDKVPLAVPKAPDTSLATRLLSQVDRIPSSAPLEPNFVPQDQVCRPTSIRACSMSTNFGIPNINQSRSQRSGCIVPKNKFQPNLVSQQLLSTYNSIIPRIRRHSVGNLGPQFNSPHRAPFKRTGSIGVASTTNRCRYSSPNTYYGSQYSRNPPPVATPTDKSSIRWQDFHGGMTPLSNAFQISNEPNVGSIFANSVPSPPQESSQPNAGSVFVNSVPSQPQVSSRPNANSVFVNAVPSRPQVPSQPYMGSIFENSVPSQPQVCSQSIPVSDNCQNVFQQGNQTQSVLDPNFTDFNLSWATPTCQSKQQSPSQLHGATDEPSLLAEQFTGSTHPGSFDFPFDSWILDNRPVSGTLDVSLLSALNVLSPETAPIDSGIFFDF